MDDRFLRDIAARIRHELNAAERLEADMVEADIKARTHDANAARIWSGHREDIIKRLNKIGMSEVEFCRKHLGEGNSYPRMRLRVQLLQGFPRYLERRPKYKGSFSLEFAVILAWDDNASNSRHASSLRSGDGIIDPSRVRVIHGDALDELRKMEDGSVHVIVTSPPYWPARRDFGSSLGFEPTLEEYIRNLVEIFDEAKRVLRKDGSLFVVIDDCRSHGQSHYERAATYSGRTSENKMTSQSAFRPPVPDLPIGNLVFVSVQFAMAMQQAGWICRDHIIWNKGIHGRKDGATTCTRRNFENVFMFTKLPYEYYYDPDPLRIPIMHPDTVTWRPGMNRKPGVLRHDLDRVSVAASYNPLGRIADSVWDVPPENLPGSTHAATFPQTLAEMILAWTCPPGGKVVDIFGGIGTTARAALKLGFQAITIDANATYCEEARQRLSGVKPGNYGPANDNAATADLSLDGQEGPTA